MSVPNVGTLSVLFIAPNFCNTFCTTFCTTFFTTFCTTFCTTLCTAFCTTFCTTFCTVGIYNMSVTFACTVCLSWYLYRIYVAFICSCFSVPYVCAGYPLQMSVPYLYHRLFRTSVQYVCTVYLYRISVPNVCTALLHVGTIKISNKDVLYTVQYSTAQ